MLGLAVADVLRREEAGEVAADGLVGAVAEQASGTRVPSEQLAAGLDRKTAYSRASAVSRSKRSSS
jgi:hypothetical protein